MFMCSNSNAANARSAGNPLSSIATSTTASSDKQRANKILVAGFAPPLFFKFATTRVLIRVLSKPGGMARRIRVNVRENIEQKIARIPSLWSGLGRLGWWGGEFERGNLPWNVAGEDVVAVLVVVGGRGRKGGLGVVGLRLVYVHSLAEDRNHGKRVECRDAGECVLDWEEVDGTGSKKDQTNYSVINFHFLGRGGGRDRLQRDQTNYSVISIFEALIMQTLDEEVSLCRIKSCCTATLSLAVNLVFPTLELYLNSPSSSQGLHLID
ncbi:hypothetical protein D5086_031651 [Populus alba]|uniref:Uncharacterized protein n=1 Tax=Populus alba TaxID=43335 RepID=A0ACC4AJ73_POPAL